jgi:acyl transferase domain-containing protein
LARDDAPVRIAPRTSNEPDKAVANESRLDRLDRLRSGYLRGHKIDWREIHRGDTPRIHLPTYRFDAQPFWFCSGRSVVSNVKIERQTNQELMS